MTRALVALMLLVTTGTADSAARPVEHQLVTITAAPTATLAVPPHVVRVRATRSYRRTPLRAAKKISSSRHAVVRVMAEVRQAVYMPLVQCWDGEVLVDHPSQTDCPKRPKVTAHQSVQEFVDSLPSPWPAIVHCESLRDDSWHTYSHSWARGLFQFLPSTWSRMGGSGDPAAASWDEQYAMARKLARLEGLRSWDCARMLGVA